jgi:hypothetical protein
MLAVAVYLHSKLIAALISADHPGLHCPANTHVERRPDDRHPTCPSGAAGVIARPVVDHDNVSVHGTGADVGNYRSDRMLLIERWDDAEELRRAGRGKRTQPPPAGDGSIHGSG